jgi:hypothetical protein
MKTPPSLAKVTELLAYNPETGIFRWLVAPGNGGRVRAGDVAGGIGDDGYVRIKIDGQKFRAHQLAWLVMTGAWPAHQLDHRDRARANNRWSNLRAATRSQNACNMAVQSHNKCGLKGVSWHKKDRKWQARITKSGRVYWLGYFKSADLAHQAYCGAAREIHGEFAGV